MTFLAACETTTDLTPAGSPVAHEAPTGLESAKINKPISWAAFAEHRTLTVTFNNQQECVASQLPATVWDGRGTYEGFFDNCPYRYIVEMLTGTGPLPGNVGILIPGERYLLAQYLVTVVGEDFQHAIEGS